MDETESSIERKTLLNNNPTSQLALLDKYVRISLIRNNTFDGFVHSIDPVSRSIILFVPQNDLHQMILIPGQAIIEVTVIPSPSNIKLSIRKQDEIEIEDHSIDRKAKLISWFKANLIPVSEMGDKIVVGNVLMLPPYGLCDICTDNPVVALQIKRIINAMPTNYEANK